LTPSHANRTACPAADFRARPERDALHARIAARPQHYVAQEWVHVSRAPVLEGGKKVALAPRTIGLRVFAVATPSGISRLVRGPG
jgi:uncharacterized circularly permuted ATP-grasp superfamily protein